MAAQTKPIEFVNFEPRRSFKKFVVKGYEKMMLGLSQPSRISLSIKKMDFNYSAYGVIRTEDDTLVGYAFSQDPFVCLKQLFRQLDQQIAESERGDEDYFQEAFKRIS